MASDAPYRDREHGGDRLADALAALDLDAPIVLGLPRGGVPVAAVVARRLRAPLDVVVVRKIGAPANPEFALGAIGEGGVEVLDRRSLRDLRLDREDLRPTIEEERRELGRRLERYRGGRPGLDVGGRTVILVDDGVATGATATAAAEVLRARGATRVVLAAPVGPGRRLESLRARFDDVVIPMTPERFLAVGAWYEDFDQTSDAEVVRLLQERRG